MITSDVVMGRKDWERVSKPIPSGITNDPRQL